MLGRLSAASLAAFVVFTVPAHAQSLSNVLTGGCGTLSPVYDGTQPRVGTIDSTGRGCVQSDTIVKGAASPAAVNTITTASTSQQLFALNPNRRGFTIQNQSTGDLYIRVGQAAQLNQTSLKIAAGQMYENPSIHVSTNVINIIGATAGQAFYAVEY